VNRGTTGVNSLPKTVTRQRRDCDLNPGPSAPESSTLTTRLLNSRKRQNNRKRTKRPASSGTAVKMERASVRPSGNLTCCRDTSVSGIIAASIRITQPAPRSCRSRHDTGQSHIVSQSLSLSPPGS